MRYTTIIDITEITSVWRNEAASRLYLYMVLKCGYNKENRDILAISLRELGYRLGMTLSAVRNAVRLLQKYHLIEATKGVYKVTKFVMAPEYEKREKTAKQQKAAAAEAARAEERKRNEERRQKDKEREISLRQQGKSSYIVYCENLLRKAAGGDVAAREAFKRHKVAYEAALKAVQTENKAAFNAETSK